MTESIHAVEGVAAEMGDLVQATVGLNQLLRRDRRHADQQDDDVPRRASGCAVSE
ncbi:MAG: hypothetical protein U0521_00505 [Anaerolineae bacterium]